MLFAGAVFATYLHDLNPVIWKITEAIQLRWYGLAYLAGFVAAFFMLQYMGRRKLWVLEPGKAGDFIAAMAIFGVFIGGRLGYLFLYHLPAAGWNTLLQDPLIAFRVWEGGMASHGGILGIVIFTWFYSRKHKLSWTGLGDGVVVVAPIGLFFGRIANFINGELYGRVTDGVAWAVKFPLSLVHEPMEVQYRVKMACARVDSHLAEYGERMSVEQVAGAARSNPDVQEILKSNLAERHPSQIYEALLEGALLFAILLYIRLRFPRAPHGTLTALFFALYAVFRIFGEQYREPDSAMIWVFSKGQFYSVFMLIFAAIFAIIAWRNRSPKGSEF
ncbi:MAG: prolipoprotein diacylglyceryl transferase [Luteolibacter sp.]